MATSYTIVLMKGFGEDLGTRALGGQVRKHIVDVLRSSPAMVLLDFAGVRVMTQSFGDEAFRKLVSEVGQAELSARLRVRNLSSDVLAVLRYATSSKAEPTAS